MNDVSPRAPVAFAVRGVLFDLDGTLADTAGDLAAALNRVRADRGLPPLPLAALRPHASHGARGLLSAGMNIGTDNAEYAAYRDAFLDYYAVALSEHTRLFPNALEVLNEIERRGLRWGIVTNKAARFTTPLLDVLAFTKNAHAVICGDSYGAFQAASSTAIGGCRQAGYTGH